MAGQPFATARLLLCEGIEDAAFLRALIRKRSLGAFDVRPVEEVGGVPGISGFFKALIGCVTWTGFRKVRSLALVADSDQHHRKAFKTIIAQIERANADSNVNGRFGTPAAPFTLGGGHPRVMIILLPGVSLNGSLETLLLEATKSVTTHVVKLRHIEEMIKSIGIARGPNRWHYSKLDKVRLRTLLTVTNKKNPALTLNKLWSHYPEFINLADTAFNSLESKLRAL